MFKRKAKTAQPAPKETQKAKPAQQSAKPVPKNGNMRPSDKLMLISLMGVGSIFFLILAFYMFLGEKYMVGGKRPDIQNDFKVKVEEEIVLSDGNYKAIIDHGNNCDESFPLGIPVLADDHPQKKDKAALLCYGKYAVHFDADTRTPLWSAHVLRRQDFAAASGKKVERTNDFRPDPDFEKLAPEISVNSEEYNGTPGIDRGHLAPAADFAYGLQPMSESFYMTNIAPQSVEHNKEIWAKLEIATRKLMNHDNIDTLYIVTGIIYKRDEKANFGYPDGSLGSFKGIKVPTYFYKVILDPKAGSSVAFVIPNTPQVAFAPYKQFATRVTDFEKFAKINFHSGLDRKAAEANIDIVNLMK